MTIPNGALHHVFFFLQTPPEESSAPKALEVVFTCDHIGSNAPGASDLVPKPSDLDSTTVTSRTICEDGLADVSPCDGDSNAVDTPLTTEGEDDDTTEVRLAKAASFLTTVATQLTAREQPDIAATADAAVIKSVQPTPSVVLPTASTTADDLKQSADEPLTASFNLDGGRPNVAAEDGEHQKLPSLSEDTTSQNLSAVALEISTEAEPLPKAANIIVHESPPHNAVTAEESPERSPLCGSVLTQDHTEHSETSTGSSKEPPRVDSTMADVSTAASPTSPTAVSAQNVARYATETPSKQKQPSLVVNTTTKNPDTHSITSSPSKNTPLSVSAAEFVPFGPVRPPGLQITAAAAEFVPSVHQPTNTAAAHHRGPRHKPATAENTKPFFEKRDTPDKGVGLFALRKIPIGTRIICEEALLKIPCNDVGLTLEAYSRLPRKKKNIYDNLYAYAPKNLDFKKEILLTIGNIDDEEVLAGHVKVMSIFAANDFVLADQIGVGVFANASRINHSCVPNVHFTNNGQLINKETVHTARDIEKGEELLATYIGPQACYQRTELRQKHLSKHYGFECKCPACSGLVPGSDANRETLQGIVWGLNEYKYQDEYTSAQHGGNPFYPASRKAALIQAEDAHYRLIQEGLVTTELAKACRFVSDFALGLGQYEKALHFAFSELEIERNIFGKEVDDRKSLLIAAEQWIASIQDRMDEDGIPMPAPKFWTDWPEKQPMWYELRREQKKRAAAEKEREVAVEKKRENYRVKKLAKKAREEEARKTANEEKKLKEADKDKEVEVKKTHGQGENKENIVEEKGEPGEASV